MLVLEESDFPALFFTCARCASLTAGTSTITKVESRGRAVTTASICPVRGRGVGCESHGGGGEVASEGSKYENPFSNRFELHWCEPNHEVANGIIAVSHGQDRRVIDRPAEVARLGEKQAVRRAHCVR